MKRLKYLLPVLTGIIILCGCASPRPVLYPNRYYSRMGKIQADKDIDQAMKFAEQHGLSATSRMKHGGNVCTDMATSTARGAAQGAVSGDPVFGTVGGAVGGGAGSITRWIFGGSQQNPAYRRFVEIYLTEQGYRVIGWQ